MFRANLVFRAISITTTCSVRGREASIIPCRSRAKLSKPRRNSGFCWCPRSRTWITLGAQETDPRNRVDQHMIQLDRMQKKLKPEQLRSNRWFGPADMQGFGHRSRLKQIGYRLEDFVGKPVI